MIIREDAQYAKSFLTLIRSYVLVVLQLLGQDLTRKRKLI